MIPIAVCYLQSGDDSESAHTRTLWITFLACAFLLPLTIVSALSAVVMRFQRGRHQYDRDHGREISPHPGDATVTGVSSLAVESTQNRHNDGRGYYNFASFCASQ